MPRPIKERIAKLREEIAQLSEANRQHLQGSKKTPDAPERERRLQRLQEIRDELMSWTDGRNHEHGITAKVRLLLGFAGGCLPSPHIKM